MKKIIFVLIIFCVLKTNAQNSDPTISVNDTLNSDFSAFENLDPSLFKTLNGQSISAFVGSNYIFPIDEMDEGISGTIIAEFVVEKDGTVQLVKIVNSVCAACDSEAIRVIKKIKTKPIEENGKSVRVQFRIPIRLVLE